MEEEEDEAEEEEEEKKEKQGEKKKKEEVAKEEQEGSREDRGYVFASIFQKAVVKLKVRLRGCFNNTKIDKTLRLFIFLIKLALCKIFV